MTNHARRLLVASALGALLDPRARAATGKPGAPEPRVLVFPRDFGSHPELRTEWWYITGHCSPGSGSQRRDFGFQLTFFRARVDGTQKMQSRFAARQLLFAHAALTDVRGKRFLHDQRVAREGFDIASADREDTAIRLRDWSLVRRDGAYVAHIGTPEFDLDLTFRDSQGVLLQGTDGLSRKGPSPEQASYYYSQPQLAFQGRLRIGKESIALAGNGAAGANADFAPGTGAAWLDHEWSDGLLHPTAAGWDWIGMNLFDGSALMAFQMRDKAGGVLWDGGAFRHPNMNEGRKAYIFARREAVFQPVRNWKSPLTNTSYPVEWLVRTPADNYLVKALLDNQELDSRNSTGAIYWEGLCDLFNANRKHVGRGYLEMTGYGKPLVL